MKKFLNKTNLLGYFALIIASIFLMINRIKDTKVEVFDTLAISFYCVALVMFITFLVWRIKFSNDKEK